MNTTRIRGIIALFGCVTLAIAPKARAGDGATKVPGVLLDAALARELGRSPGDSVRIVFDGGTSGPVVYRIEGWLTGPPDPSQLSSPRRLAVMSLPHVEEMTGNHDALSRIVLATGAGIDPEEVARRLNQRAFGYRAYTASQLARDASEVFVVVSNFHKAISVLAVLTGAMFLAAIVMLQVQELRKPLGVLRLIGISRRRIFTVVIGETVFLANVGSLLGIALAYGVSFVVNRYYQAFFDTRLVFSVIEPTHVVLACAVSTLIGLVVGTVATLYLLQLRLTEVIGR